MVKIELDEGTFSTLIGGLYSTYRNIDVCTVPPYFWLQLAHTLAPYMERWRYDIQSIEEWIGTNLIITAEEICTEEEIEYFKTNTIFVRVENGNVNLIGAGDILWENSSDTSSEKEKDIR